ncbi:MAG TPA: allantoinase AllB [Thermoanaerobaculia bacterium]|nr:allantoinase AllB [Thermoanaerobaculia bacterium]
MILRSRNIVTPQGIQPATIHVNGRVIERIGELDDVPEGAPVDDFGELTLIPGLVDSHVHVNEPGRTEWEGFETATRAAAAGGVTTIVDMPLNSIPPTTSVAALEAKVRAIEGKCRVDVALWGGAVPGNAGQLRAMLDAGACGFKCFLVDSGVPEFGHLEPHGLEEALNALRGTGAPLLVHAELPEHLYAPAGDDRSYASYLATRPVEAEDEAIALVYALARKTGTHAHIVHLSSANGLDALRRARAAHVPLTAETTPHYLYFTAERVPDGATEFKCAPPIRGHANREALWRGLEEGLLSAVVSDHSPCTPELKRMDEGDIAHAWGGIASLQFGLPIVWTEAKKRGIAFETIVSLMTTGPATLAGLGDRKGRLEAGYDADIVVIDPEARFVVRTEHVEHRHKVTPYAGETLTGVVKATYVRGHKVWQDGLHLGNAIGEWVTRAKDA